MKGSFSKAFVPLGGVSTYDESRAVVNYSGYGSLNQRVSNKLSEYALRLALGAQLRQVVWICIRSLLVILVLAAGAGYLVSLSLRHLTKSLLFGTIDKGAGTTLVSALIVLVVAVAAATVPLMRLKHFDLVATLRGD